MAMKWWSTRRVEPHDDLVVSPALTQEQMNYAYMPVAIDIYKQGYGSRFLIEMFEEFGASRGSIDAFLSFLAAEDKRLADWLTMPFDAPFMYGRDIAHQIGADVS